MWDKILKFLNDNKDALGWLFGSGVVLAVLGGIYRLIVWLIKEYRLRRIRTNENFPFKIIPSNSNVAKEILGGADDDPLADRNIPYQQRIHGQNTRRELEELIEDHRWILIAGRTGLGKTREATQLAQSLNNEGWTILYLTRETWLDAPAKLPNNVPERKLLFFLDDLNKKCLSSKAEIRPDARESLTLPIYEPFQTRLQRTLEAFDTFCGKSEIKVIATARNEKISEFDEPSEWDKLGWTKYDYLWRNFKLHNLPEPDERAEEKLLIDAASKAKILIESGELSSLAKRNDGTFRNLVENISYAKTEGHTLSAENFRDTLKGTWQKRYQRATQNNSRAKHIYDAIELLRDIGIRPRFSTTVEVAQIISDEKLWQRVKSRRRYSHILNGLIKTENILNPRDGQIEAKGYRLDVEKYLPKLYKQIYFSYFETDQSSLLETVIRLAAYSVMYLAPRSLLNPFTKVSQAEKIVFSIFALDTAVFFMGTAYFRLGFTHVSQQLFRKSLEIENISLMNRIFFRSATSMSWNRLGATHLRLREYEDAIVAYKNATELDSKYKYNWKDLGDAYVGLKLYDNAIQAYNKAIELDSKFALAWSAVGHVHRKQRKYEDAILSYKKAIEFDRNRPNTWNALGNIYLLIKDYETALEAFSKAVELSPAEGYLHASMVGVLRKLSKDIEADEHEKIARLTMKDETVYNQACFQSICGNTEEAVRLLKKALEEELDVEWAQQDPDFDFIRDDPRFKVLVGL